MFSHKNLNSSDCINTWRNVNLTIVLIKFWAYTKRPKISFECFLFARRSPVISPQVWQLWRNS